MTEIHPIHEDTEALITAYMNASIAAKKVPYRLENLTYFTETGDAISLHAFKENFGDVDTLEKEVFHTLFVYTLKMLALESLNQEVDVAERLLSFYYTLFEVFTANRDYIALRFQSPLVSLKSLKRLDKIKAGVTDFLADINQYDPVIPLPGVKMIQEKAFTEAGWLQFLSVFQFWLKDTSPDYERTDALIEKSLLVGLDVLKLQQAERHVVDWAKFWLSKEQEVPNEYETD